MSQDEIHCLDCQLQLPASSERSPCPTCGSTKRVFDVSISETLGLKVTLSRSVAPGHQSIDVPHFLRKARADISDLRAQASASGLTSEDARQWKDKLISAICHLYGIKDHVNKTVNGTSKAEDYIRTSTTLRRHADTANHIKHVYLNDPKSKNPPWTGGTPVIGEVAVGQASSKDTHDKIMGPDIHFVDGFPDIALIDLFEQAINEWQRVASTTKTDKS